MSRRRRSRRRNDSRRDTFDIANRRLPTRNSRFDDPRPKVKFRDFDLRDIEDRRRWHPEGLKKPAKQFNRTRPQLQVVQGRPSTAPRFEGFGGPLKSVSSFAFTEPKAVLTCVRRKQRKEVMFAKRKAGKAGQKKPKFNALSKVRCK